MKSEPVLPDGRTGVESSLTPGRAGYNPPMPHWDRRPEPKWKQFQFKQPYEKGLRRLRDEVLAKTDFDPATLWQWGTGALPKSRWSCRGASTEGDLIAYGHLNEFVPAPGAEESTEVQDVLGAL